MCSFWPWIYTGAKSSWFESDGFINMSKECIEQFTSDTRGIVEGATYDY